MSKDPERSTTWNSGIKNDEDFVLKLMNFVLQIR